jgi:hypothetical protein
MKTRRTIHAPKVPSRWRVVVALVTTTLAIGGSGVAAMEIAVEVAGVAVMPHIAVTVAHCTLQTRVATNSNILELDVHVTTVTPRVATTILRRGQGENEMEVEGD